MTEITQLNVGNRARVRAATSADADGIIAMCRRQHSEEGYLFSLSDDRVRHYIDKALSHNGGVMGVIGEPGQLRASVYMELGQPWYSEAWSLHELWTYVLPEHRASSFARDLIAYMKFVEKALGVPLVTSMISSVRTASKVRLYRKSFGEPVGAVFVHSSSGRA